MDCRAQSALEYLLTYGWALVAIGIVMGSLLFLTSNASAPHNCQMTPSSGAITYIDHSLINGKLDLMLQNDSGKTIRDVNSAYSGDFSSGAGTINNGPFLSAQQFIISTTGVSVSSGTSYSGTVTITYKRNGVNFVSSAVCTGVA